MICIWRIVYCFIGLGICPLRYQNYFQILAVWLLDIVASAHFLERVGYCLYSYLHLGFCISFCIYISWKQWRKKYCWKCMLYYCIQNKIQLQWFSMLYQNVLYQKYISICLLIGCITCKYEMFNTFFSVTLWTHRAHYVETTWNQRWV